MEKELTLDLAKEIVKKHVSEPHLITHALAVSAAMGKMAEYFGEDTELWRAVGYLHDVDFEKYPEEHCHHVQELLEPEGISPEIIRTIESHGWKICCEVEPLSNMEKSLYTVDELTGIIMAASLMRPNGIADLEVKSAMKKFKDKKFAAKCNREVIRNGCDLLGVELSQVMELCILGMQSEMEALGLGPKEV